MQLRTVIGVRIASLSFLTNRALALLALCFLLTGPAWSAGGSKVSPAKPAEYMIYQYPGVALLIRLDAVGSEFDARVYGPERALIKASHVPMRRIGPIYQFIEPVDTARQLMVEVTPAYELDRSRINLELVQLASDQRTSALQVEAFRLMSRAMEITTANDSSTWAMKSYTFRNTAGAFAQLGWEELRLWSEYYAAHLVFFKLGDELSAIELARQVQIAARRAGLSEIEMTALQLEGAAWLATNNLAPGQTAEQKFVETHRVLGRASELAANLGFEAERAWALYNDGRAWEEQENLQLALAQYRLALDIAVSVEDAELANQIRNRAASAYETQGSVSGAIEMLDQLGDELSADDVELELAESLYEKGRILFRSYRYPEAVEALSEAYALQESVGSTSRLGLTGLILGQALHGLGQFPEAASVLQASVGKVSSAGHENDLLTALQTLAAIKRFDREFSALPQVREEQEKFIRTDSQRAAVLFERALDLFASSGESSASAQSLLQQSRRLAAAAGDRLLAYRAVLQFCAHGSGKSSSREECAEPLIQQASEYLLSAGIPRYALEARFALSNILWSENQNRMAVTGISQLLDDIRYYHQELPGVLGGWYWENRGLIFDRYMSMVLQQSQVVTGKPADGQQVLRALEQLSAIDSVDSRQIIVTTGGDHEQDASELRSMLMSREDTESPATALKAAVPINELLQKGKSNHFASRPPIDLARQKSLLERMPAGSALLTYYFTAADVYAVLAQKGAVQLFKLGRFPDARLELNEVRETLGDGHSVDTDRLDELGSRLLKPIAHLLPQNIFLIPRGSLSGFPFDLLRLDNHYLAEKYQVVNLMSVAGLLKPAVRVEPSETGLFFLAGDPQGKRDVFDYEQSMSAEVRAVTDQFVGPALHIIQGSALKRDEFQDERFERADMIHLAIPGMISLDSPALSALMLSARPEQVGSDSLGPIDFQDRQFNASLAFLSATSVKGSSEFGFSNYLGFVSDLLLSGVDAVIVSLWLLEDTDRARFMTAFYTNLEDTPDLAAALLKTRLDFFRQAESNDVTLWGGFQIYLN